MVFLAQIGQKKNQQKRWQDGAVVQRGNGQKWQIPVSVFWWCALRAACETYWITSLGFLASFKFWTVADLAALGANHDENEDGMMKGLMLISSSLYVIEMDPFFRYPQLKTPLPSLKPWSKRGKSEEKANPILKVCIDNLHQGLFQQRQCFITIFCSTNGAANSLHSFYIQAGSLAWDQAWQFARILRNNFAENLENVEESIVCWKSGTFLHATSHSCKELWCRLV